MAKKTNKKTKVVYTRISDALDKKLKLACVNRDTKRPDAIAQAISDWVAPPSKELRITPTESAITGEELLPSGIGIPASVLLRWKAEIEKLVRVLESGNPDAVRGITMNLEWADSWVRTHEPEE